MFSRVLCTCVIVLLSAAVPAHAASAAAVEPYPYAIAAPTGTPRPIVKKLHDEIAAYFTSPETQKQLTAMGAVLDIRNADEMRKVIPAEIAKWTKVAIDAGMPRDK